MMRRKITALICSVSILATALLTCGCHGRKQATEYVAPTGFDMSREYEIVFWSKNDNNLTQKAIYNQAIADFEALYPNIHVTIKAYTDYSKIYNDVITNIATDTTPNICITYPDHIATYMTGENVVVPLDDLISNPEYGLGGSEVLFDSPSIDEMVPQFVNECTIGDHIYAMPFMRSTEACYINKTYVEALGYEVPDILTWDFIWEVSDAATRQNSDGTYFLNNDTTMIPFIYKSTDNMMIQYLRQAGAEYSTSEGDILLFNDTTRVFLREIADHVELGSFSTFKISSYPGNFINAGQCIFGIDSTAGSTWIGSHAPLVDIAEEDLVEFETVVRPIPQINPSNPQMISQGPSVCIFNKEDQGEVMASWLFVQFLLTNEVQMAYAETEGYIPVTLAAQNDPAYLDYLGRAGEDDNLYYDVKIQATQMFLDNVDNTFVTPVFNGSTSVRDAAGTMIENTCKSINRHQQVNDVYFTNLFDTVSAQYNLNQLGGNAGVKSDLGPLPSGSVALLTTLGVVWVMIIAYFTYDTLKSKKK